MWFWLLGPLIMIVVQEYLPQSIILHQETRCHGHNMHDPATTRAITTRSGRLSR
jgi:hypothetical protein